MSPETEEVKEEKSRDDSLADGGQGVFEVLQASGVSEGVDEERCLDLLRDVSLKVKVELGRGKMLLRDILRLTNGSVVELEKLAGEELDIFVNERLIARGEVLVLDDNFCVRITEILSTEECIRIKQD